MLVKLVNDCSHLIIKEVNHTIVKRGQDPRTSGVKGDPFDSVAFEFKFGQHGFFLALRKGFFFINKIISGKRLVVVLKKVIQSVAVVGWVERDFLVERGRTFELGGCS